MKKIAHRDEIGAATAKSAGITIMYNQSEKCQVIMATLCTCKNMI